MSRPPCLTDAQWRWIGDRWLEGYSQVDLAEFLGVSRETVRRWLTRLGLRPFFRDELPPLEERKKEYMDLWKGASDGDT